MKKIFTLTLFIASSALLLGQCSTVSIQVSSSDTNSIQLYHAGFFNIPSGFANVCIWEVSSFSGEVIFKDTTSGAAFEQGQVFFNHSVPITDSIKATIVITNDTSGIRCTINDTLVWRETEVVPGSFVGGWEAQSSNGGIEEDLTSNYSFSGTGKEMVIYPSPVQSYFQISGKHAEYSISIYNLFGQLLMFQNNVQDRSKIDVSFLPPGMYSVQIRNSNSNDVGFLKIVKNYS